MANFNLNKVILGGRLTADPEIKQTATGVPVTSFSIAVNRAYSSKDGDRQADFINVVAWRQTAEFITRYFRRGSSICIVGSIQTRSWTDQNGGKRYATEVVVEEAHFVDSKSESSGGAGQGSYMPDAYANEGTTPPAYSTQPGTAPKFEDIEDDDDLPF